MFFIIGIFIAIFLSLLLLIKKNKSRADKVLVIWLLFLCLTQTLRYLTWTGYLYNYPHWLGVELSLPIIHAVLLFFYVREVTGNSLKNRWIILAHFTTTFLLFFLVIPFYKLTGTEKIQVYQNHATEFDWAKEFFLPLLVISGIVYSILSFLIIIKHQNKIQNHFSNTDKKELLWLKYLVIGNTMLYILSIFYDNYIINMGVVILVLFIGFFGINQLNIFNTTVDFELVLDEENKGVTSEINAKFSERKISTEKYAKSGLNKEMASQIYTNLNALVNENAIYINEELTLIELAKQLDVHPNHLSQVINEMEGKNFYNYINFLRINEFIKIAQLPENKIYTMISLAYDCGFSAKSTFNRHFKLNTGKTPTEFFKS